VSTVRLACSVFLICSCGLIVKEVLVRVKWLVLVLVNCNGSLVRVKWLVLVLVNCNGRFGASQVVGVGVG
jgi:hypothetical protein